jgi:ADP-ribose pyrophosphatase YjhB (NUDIX family)
VSRKQPLTLEEFTTIFSKVTRLCVDLIIVTDAGVLLTYRTKNGYENQWHLPGGTIFYRERVEEAVARIAQEELGIKVKIDQLLGYIEYFSEVKERGFGYTISIAFKCTPETDNLTLDDQVEKAEYFKELPINVIEEQEEILTRLQLVVPYAGQ